MQLVDGCNEKLVHEHLNTIISYIYNGKGKVIPLQARCGPEGG